MVKYTTITLEIWNHGEDAGGVLVLWASGDRIPNYLLTLLGSDSSESFRSELFGGLPTEKTLIVECELRSGYTGEKCNSPRINSPSRHHHLSIKSYKEQTPTK